MKYKHLNQLTQQEVTDSYQAANIGIAIGLGAYFICKNIFASSPEDNFRFINMGKGSLAGSFAPYLASRVYGFEIAKRKDQGRWEE
ncbi:MAG: hypothetical protein WC796_05975 [Candidatus Pacearchaeota archaeon]|jgi:hypothetical protein